MINKKVLLMTICAATCAVIVVQVSKDYRTPSSNNTTTAPRDTIPQEITARDTVVAILRGGAFFFQNDDGEYVGAAPISYNPIDTVIGRFRRGVVDTLVLEPTCEPSVCGDYIEYWNWRIRSVKGSVKDLQYDNSLWVSFCNAGDLDGNGTDDICVFSRSYSNFVWYYVITFRKNAWHCMTDALFAHQAYMPDDISTYVEKSNKPGYIRALVCKDIYGQPKDSIDWLGVEVVDSLVKLKRNGKIYQ